MERLTKIDGCGNADLIACFGCSPGSDNEKCGFCEKPLAAYDKLAEYEEAEEEGRLVVLPCAKDETLYVVGSTVREWTGFFPAVCYVERGLINHIPLGILQNAIGKTVFFTRAEAEAALGKEGFKC